MKNSYQEFKEHCEKKIYSFMNKDNAVVTFYNQKQFDDVLAKLHLTSDEFVAQYSSNGGGVYLRKDRSEQMNKLIEDNYALFEQNLKNDPDGSHFIRDMFSCELNDHEYSYTHNLSSTLNSLTYLGDDAENVIKRINDDPKLKHGLELALDEIKHYEIFCETITNKFSDDFYTCIYSDFKENERINFFSELNKVCPRDFYEKLLESDDIVDFLHNYATEYTSEENRVSVFIDTAQNLEKLNLNEKLIKLFNSEFKLLNECIKKGNIQDHIIKDYLKSFNNPNFKYYVFGKKKLYDNQEKNSDYIGLKR